MEHLNAERRAVAQARETAPVAKGSRFLAETQKQRAELRRVARERLDRASFLQCCWEIITFRMLQEVAQDALALVVWGDLRGDLVERCRFPTTWARIQALDEAGTPEYRECPADDPASDGSGEREMRSLATEAAPSDIEIPEAADVPETWIGRARP